MARQDKVGPKNQTEDWEEEEQSPAEASQPHKEQDAREPRKKGFLGAVVEDLWDTRSTEALQLLLTERESWKELVEQAGLSRSLPWRVHTLTQEPTPGWLSLGRNTLPRQTK